MKFSGKKLLILGSNAGSIDIVKYAQHNGAVVYVADYLDIDNSEAKKIADNPVNISSADIDKLSILIRKEKIDGVFSGISGFNILKSMELAERFGFPFYCNKKQWELIEHKDNFRRLCDKYSVPCPRTYYKGADIEKIDWSSVIYPIVIKPADSGASSGVHICSCREEAEKSLVDALSFSDKGSVIIEEFVDGYEFTAHYTIYEGKAVLSSIDNRYPVAVHSGNVTTIPIARIYPSLFLDSYLHDVDPQMRTLCEGIGLNNAILFVQGIYSSSDKRFAIFEAGMRSAAECPSRIVEAVTGQNPFFMLVDHILLEKVQYDLLAEAPDMHGKVGAIVSFVAKGGTVGNINGLDKTLRCIPSVINYESRYPVGSVTPNGDTLRQLMLRFIMLCENRNDMIKDITAINNGIDVTDQNGNDMVIKFDPHRLMGLI